MPKALVVGAGIGGLAAAVALRGAGWEWGRHWVRGTLACTVVATFGCGSPDDAAPDLPDDRVWQSDHFAYHSRASNDFECEAILTILERHRSALEAYFGAEATADRIDYYLFDDEADLAATGICAAAGNHCAGGSDVYSFDPFQTHELIHAYLSKVGYSARFLMEGVAEALSCGMRREALDPVSLERLVEWPDNGLDLYSTSGILVASLLRAHGPEKFLALYRRVRLGATLPEVEQEFEAEYGMTLVDAMEAAASDPGELGCVRIWECAGAPWDVTESSIDLSDVCRVPAFRPIRSDVASVFSFMTAGYGTRLGSCEETAPPPNHVFSDTKLGDIGTSLVVALQPGDYFLGAQLPLEPRTTFSPAPEVVGSADTCSSLSPIVVAALNDVTIFVDGSLGGAAGVEGDRVLMRLRDFLDAPAPLVRARCEGTTASLCDGCEPSSCSEACSPEQTPGPILSTPSDLIVELTIPTTASKLRLDYDFDSDDL